MFELIRHELCETVEPRKKHVRKKDHPAGKWVSKDREIKIFHHACGSGHHFWTNPDTNRSEYGTLVSIV